MQAGMGITDGIIQGKISCFRNKFHKHKEKCSEKRKFLGALCLRSEQLNIQTAFSLSILNYNLFLAKINRSLQYSFGYIDKSSLCLRIILFGVSVLS